MGELYAALAGLLVYPYVALTYIMIPKCEETIEKGNENATHCTITDILRAEIFKDGILQISTTTISGVITYNMASRQKIRVPFPQSLAQVRSRLFSDVLDRRICKLKKGLPQTNKRN